MSDTINIDLNLISDEAIVDLEHDSLDFNVYDEGKDIIKDVDEYIDNRIDEAVQFFKTQNDLHNYQLIHGRVR